MSAAKNWDDVIDAEEAERFVGREQELETFRQEMLSLTASQQEEKRIPWFVRIFQLLRHRQHTEQVPGPVKPAGATHSAHHYFIFYISGQGGVGKTTLLNRYREIARSAHCLLAESDERQKDVPSTLGQFAHQLVEQGVSLKHFSERYKTYQQRMHEIENDPKAPQGWGALVGRTMVRAVFVGADIVPGVRKIATLLPEEALEEQASEWSAYLAKKAFNKDDIALIRDPIPILTALFFKDLNEIAEKTPILLLFENFEATRPELQEWLLRLPEYQPSARVRIVIASRSEAGANWDTLHNVILTIRLDAFSQQEAEQFLDRYGITDRERRREILEYSGRLPVIMSWLAAPGGQTSGLLPPAQNIVARFLQWVAEPTLREVALRASLPRTLNLDILSVLLRSQDQVLIEAHQAFTWLQTMPFVTARSDGWQYHEVVRRMMLRYQHAISPQTYCQLHATLADFYLAQREELGLSGTEMWANEEWRKATLLYCYHFLVANPTRHWSAVLSIFTLAVRRRRTFAREIADLLCLEDVQGEFSEEQSNWLQFVRRELRKLMRGTNQDGFELFEYLCQIKDLSPEARGHVLAYRGECYRQEGQWEKALADFNSALQLIPNDAHTITRRSVVYILTERYAEALTDLERSLAIDANGIWAIAMRGETSRRLQRYDEALADFTRAMALDEKYAWFIAMRGETYRQMSMYELALADFDQALSLKVSENWVLERREQTAQLLQEIQRTTQTLPPPLMPQVSIPSWNVPGQRRYPQPPIPYPSSLSTGDPSYQYYYPLSRAASGSESPYPPIPSMPGSYHPPIPPLPSPPSQSPSRLRYIRSGGWLSKGGIALFVLLLIIAIGIVVFVSYYR